METFEDVRTVSIHYGTLGLFVREENFAYAKFSFFFLLKLYQCTSFQLKVAETVPQRRRVDSIIGKWSLPHHPTTHKVVVTVQHVWGFGDDGYRNRGYTLLNSWPTFSPYLYNRVWSELTCRNSLSHSRLACSCLSAHIQPSMNNPDTNSAAKLLNTTRQYNYNGHELS